MSDSKNTSLIVGIIAVTVLLFGGLAWLLVRTPASPSVNNAGQPENVTFSDENNPFVGPADAKVVVRFFSDFQCPACRYAEPALKATMEQYRDRVKFIWKDFPLETIHPNARIASEAGRCAAVEGKFWEYHDQLFAKQSEWEALPNAFTKLVEYGAQVGITSPSFSACLQSRGQTALVRRDINEGFANNVDRTPTVFINNRRYFAMTSAEWKKNLDAALAEVASMPQ
ncbi:thioredoxin domain-containing protein [Patescibacteria group bacterium]|nr:thioredoxin domain-containing protein [Patescibacteria group bacterium]MBP9710633.1 thioredoxin domain-containing protein [Patescibacteria group bacterium]